MSFGSLCVPTTAPPAEDTVMPRRLPVSLQPRTDAEEKVRLMPESLLPLHVRCENVGLAFCAYAPVRLSWNEHASTVGEGPSCTYTPQVLWCASLFASAPPPEEAKRNPAFRL